jgi:hypothetical protein
LLNAGDRRILDLVGVAVLDKRCIDLASTEDNPIDLIWLLDGVAVFRIWNDPLEMFVFEEFVNVRSGDRMTEERLREEDNQG